MTMRRSTDGFLTTHTGSLPRPPDLIRMMFAKEEGVPVEPTALGARIRAAVVESVRKQIDAGVAIVNDGEMSKPSYATYVKDRLNGFGGASHPLQYRDLVDFPEMAKRVFGDPGRSRRRTPACDGPISVRDARAAETDVANLLSACGPSGAEHAFMSAASPRRGARRHRRRAVYGAAERPLGGGVEPAARARVAIVRACEAATGQGAHSRRARLDDQLHRASGSGRRAHRPLREFGRSRERRRRHRLWLRHLGGSGGRRPRHRVGQARQHGRGRAPRDARVLLARPGWCPAASRRGAGAPPAEARRKFERRGPWPSRRLTRFP